MGGGDDQRSHTQNAAGGQGLPLPLPQAGAALLLELPPRLSDPLGVLSGEQVESAQWPDLGLPRLRADPHVVRGDFLTELCPAVALKSCPHRPRTFVPHLARPANLR